MLNRMMEPLLTIALKWLVLVALLWLVLLVQAWADMNQAQALEAGKQLGNTATSTALPAVDANSLPGFTTASPTETQYQSAGIGLEDTARSHLLMADPASPEGSVFNSITTRPSFTLNRDDPLVQHTASLMADAENAPDAGTATACKTLTVTDPPVEGTDNCMEYLKTLDSTCKRNLAVSCAGGGGCGGNGHVSVSALTGNLLPGLGVPTVSEYQHDGKRVIRLTNGWQGFAWTFRWNIADSSKIRSIKVLKFSGVANVTYLSFGPNPNYWVNVTGSYFITTFVGQDVTSKILSYPYSHTLVSSGNNIGVLPGNYVDFIIDEDCGCQNWVDTWTDSCGAYSSDPLCELQTSTCTDSRNPRVISGASVSRPCWQYTDTYRCYDQSGGKGEDDYCKELRDAGCTQSGSTCADYLYGRCIAWEQSYQCAVPGKTRTEEDCSAANYCQDGNCFDGGYEANNDFGLAASYLSSAEAMAKDLDGGFSIFGGNQHQCKKTSLGFKNCCKNSGWGLGLSLSQCSESEKVLGEKRGAGMCHYLGSYKDGSLFPNRYDSYCCFNSKLARIIHEQGRPYVPLAWGSAKSPECRGFTPEELEQVDFGKIDFSEFFADALAQADKAIKPANGTLGEQIRDKLIRLLPP